MPITKKAMAAGIKVISFDSGIAPEGRILHLAPSGDEFIGRSQIKMAADLIGDSGEVAILSASSQATNQNAWIEWMKKELENHPNMKLDAVVYGDDLSDKSYREANGLFKSYPEPEGIIAPTTVGIAAAGKATRGRRTGGQGPAHRPGASLGDEAVHQGRDLREDVAVEPHRPWLFRHVHRGAARARADQGHGQ